MRLTFKAQASPNQVLDHPPNKTNLESEESQNKQAFSLPLGETPLIGIFKGLILLTSGTSR
jgi:hypothetical protein